MGSWLSAVAANTHRACTQATSQTYQNPNDNEKQKAVTTRLYIRLRLFAEDTKATPKAMPAYALVALGTISAKQVPQGSKQGPATTVEVEKCEKIREIYTN